MQLLLRHAASDVIRFPLMRRLEAFCARAKCGCENSVRTVKNYGHNDDCQRCLNSILKTSSVVMRYAVLLQKTDTGYSAHVPDLPGCVAAGATLEETTDLIRGAVRMHLAGMAEDGEPVLEPKTIVEYIVAA